jgi:uncharacterized iron-regulated membrane protein
VNPVASKSASSAASKPRTGPSRLTAGLVWFHRWLGVATCLVFALWFASGAVLLFKPFPSLPRDEGLAMQAPLDLNAVTVSPASAVNASRVPASGMRLIERAGRPAYIIDGGDRAVAVDAVTGDKLPLLSARQAGTTGNAFDYDQWIVHNQFDPFRPLFRMKSERELGTDLYRSAVTGETVQRTTASDRAWNWVGAVLHWVYFTPIRSSFTVWDWGVWTLSFIAMLVAIAGTILGIMRTLTAMRQRKASLSYFRLKWLRWHHLLGLFAAIFVLAWIFSGWLSMDHGRLFSPGVPKAAEGASYQGGSWSTAVSKVAVPTLKQIRDARQITFNIVNGTPVLIVHGLNGHVTRLDAQARPFGDAALDQLIMQGIKRGWTGAKVETITPVEPYNVYGMAEGWPATASRVALSDHFPDIYVDHLDGRILTIMDDSRAAYSWVYYALHTFNFPGLSSRPLLREIIVLIPLSAGFAFSVTGVVIGWQRLRKELPSKRSK